MHRSPRRLARLLPLALLLATAACGGGGAGSDEASFAQLSQRPGGEFSPVVATVGPVDITREYLDYRFEQLPAAEKGRYGGEDGEARFLDKLVEETLMVLAAREEKDHLDPEVEMRLDMAVRSVLLKAHYDRRFIEELPVPEEEVQRYYEENPDQFVNVARMRANVIVTSTQAKAQQAWAELQAGTPFTTVATQYSEDDATRENGGNTGWFNPGGYVLGIGFNEEFTDYAFQVEPDVTLPPRQIGDRWYIVKGGARVPGEKQEISKARDRIVNTLRPVLAKEAFDRYVDELEEQYGVTREGEFQRDPRNAEQLFAMGVETANPHARLDHFTRLVTLYPDHERADDALFMIGFIHSEDFGDEPLARVAFRQLLRDFPDSPYAADARFMMQNLGRKVPAIRGNRTPRTPDDISGRIDAAQQAPEPGEGGQ